VKIFITRLFSLCFFILPLFSIAQRDDNPPRPKTTYVIPCDPITLIGNLAFNQKFDAVSGYNIANPFGLGQVSNWTNAFGSPNFETIAPQNLPFPGIHAAFMNSTYVGSAGPILSEGLLGKLSPLTPGNPYSLSFYLNYFNEAIPNASHAYNIYLMHCSDATTYFPDPDNNPPLPAMPPNSQRIFCETNGGSAIWRQLSICFTPDQNYDMILIFPAVTPTTSTPAYTVSVGFAYPELISRSASDFSILVSGAGDAGNPCIKTLSPSYAVTNATYQWFLNGNLFSTAQNPQIDASFQYGTISVQVTLPNANTNNSCSQSCGILTASVNISACIPNWPKVYNAAQPNPNVLMADNSGNIFFSMYTPDMTYNYNHNGGTVPNTPGNYCVQYNKATGATNWISSNNKAMIVLSSGIIQLNTDPYNGINTIFRDCSNGSIVTGPNGITSGEIILAEDNGAYITRTNTNFIIHDGNGPHPPIPFFSDPNYITTSVLRTIYNPLSQRLFVNYEMVGPVNSIDMVAVYQFANSNLTLINSPLTIPMPYGGGELCQVNTHDEIFILGPDRVYKYDYVNNTCTSFFMGRFYHYSNTYAEDKVLANDQVQNYVYYINTITQQQKKIPYVSYLSTNLFCFFLFQGDDVFLIGGYETSNLGNQIIPLLGGSVNFITKLNIGSDFNFRQLTATQSIKNNNYILPIDSSNTKVNEKSKVATPALDMTLSPNPAKEILQINLKQSNQKLGSSFSIVVTDSKGASIIRKNIVQKTAILNISQLKAGVYYVTAINNNGETSTKSFLKE